MQEGFLRIAQISDTHLFSDPERSLLGVKPQVSFQAVFELLKNDPIKPDLILLTGDLSQDETAQSYRILADKFSELDIPIYFVPGNHDEDTVLIDNFTGKNIFPQKQIIVKDWQIILLNSHKSGCIEGFLRQSELDYLQECLQQYPQYHTIIAIHHHPVPVGSRWIDKYALTNASAFWNTVEKLNHVKMVLFGHVHQLFEQKKSGIHCYAVPSTCFQFKGHSQNFAIEKLPPGYRWLDLYNDGTFKTGISRIQQYIGEFDENATGY